MFKVGDRVHSEKFGDGTVIALFEEQRDYGVCFDKSNVKLHSSGSKCENYHGWFYDYNGISSGGTDKLTLIPSIKVGDTVRLIDKYYEHEDFKKLSRWFRMEISKDRKATMVVGNIGKSCFCDTADMKNSESIVSFPLSLLERVEPKAKEEPIPTERLVKRHAKVGEKIRIVEAECTCGTYRNGDTLTVSRDFDSRSVKVTDEFCPFIRDSEYLVIESGKHVYTDEQKAEALRIATEILNENYKQNPIPNKEIVVKLWGGKIGKSKCAPTDEYAYEIGLMVACCHATGRKLPDWIK